MQRELVERARRQLMILLDGAAPMFVDVESGEVTTGPETWNPPYTWRRLAP